MSQGWPDNYLEACTQPERGPSTARPLFYRDECYGCLVALIALSLQPGTMIGQHARMGYVVPADVALRTLQERCDEFDPLRVRAEPLLTARGGSIST